MRIYIDEEMKQCIIKDYVSGLSAMKIAKKYLLDERKYHRVIKIISLAGIEIRDSSQRRQQYSIDEHVFDNIDTEEKAYMIGFMFADAGRVQNSILICLHQRDRHILERFNEILKSNKPIKTYIRYDGSINNRVDICNKKLCTQLEKLGIVFRKTFKIRFPTYLDDGLVKHFIRGYFDGDGCLTITKTRNKALISITSNEMFCEQLKIHIEKRVNINCLINPIYGNKCNSQIKRTVVSGNKQILTFLDWLYDDATIYLERKYQKYIQLKNDPISSKKVKLKQLDVVNPITIPTECI